MATDGNQIKQKTSNKYYCEICDYGTSRKSNMDNHCMTSKHINSTFGHKNKQNEQMSKKYICKFCNKNYKDRTGLWKHKSKCDDAVNQVSVKNTPEITPEFITLIAELVKGQQTMIELCKNNVITNNIQNNISTNSHNKTFNLNLFLNETCKDAMNIMDFVESIKLQVTDLERIGEVGYVEGISDIIVSNLNKLDITQRPIHCTDKKRETMYVKDAGKWEKDENTNLIRRAIRKVTHNNQRLLPQFKEKYPDYHNSYSSHSDKVTKVVIETMVNNVPDKEEKIIRNIAKSVVLDKTHTYTF